MAEELDTLVLKIRADTTELAADAAKVKAIFDETAKKIGSVMSEMLAKLITQGKLGLEDWKRLVREILTELAKLITEAIFQKPEKQGGGTLAGILAQAATVITTGGQTSSGAALGRALTLGGGGAGRAFNISINVAAPESASPQLMQRSAQQVARAVRRAVLEV